jgi:hypothetical protein
MPPVSIDSGFDDHVQRSFRASQRSASERPGPRQTNLPPNRARRGIISRLGATAGNGLADQELWRTEPRYPRHPDPVCAHAFAGLRDHARTPIRRDRQRLVHHERGDGPMNVRRRDFQPSHRPWLTARRERPIRASGCFANGVSSRNAIVRASGPPLTPRQARRSRGWPSPDARNRAPPAPASTRSARRGPPGSGRLNLVTHGADRDGHTIDRGPATTGLRLWRRRATL